MLSDEVIEKVVERLVNRIEQGNEFILEQIGKKVKQIGTMTPTQAQNLIQVLKYGGDYEKIVKYLAKITKLNVQDIHKIFEEIAKHDLNFAKQFYDYRKIKFIPYEKNLALKRQVEALARLTSQKYVEIARSSAIGFSVRDDNNNIIMKGLKETIDEVIDKAVLAVVQGKETYQDQMYKVLKNIGESGVKVLDYSNGRTLRLDSAIRMFMDDAIRQLHNEEQEQIGKSFHSDGVEITVHLNPAPDHEEVQGRQFSNEQFLNFQTDKQATSYDGIVFEPEHNGYDRRSISQYNCKHYTFAILLGVNIPQYSDEQLKRIIEQNHKGFDFDGKHYTNYEGTQLQRRLEVEIRKQKDMQILGKTSGNEELMYKSQKKINILTNKYKQVSEVSGLPTKMDRLRVPDYRKVALKEVEKPSLKRVDNKEGNILLMSNSNANRDYRTIEEWQDYFGHKYGSYNIFEGVIPYDKEKTPMFKINDDIKTLNSNLMNTQFAQLDYLFDKYKIKKGITISKSNTTRFIAQASNNEIMYSKHWFTDADKLISSAKRGNESGWHSKVPEERLPEYTTTHEFGHYLEHRLQDKHNDDHTYMTYEKFDTYIRERIFDKELSYKNYRNITELKKNCLSRYGNARRHYEWFAETFAGMELGTDNDLTRAMKEVLEEYYE